MIGKYLPVRGAALAASLATFLTGCQLPADDTSYPAVTFEEVVSPAAESGTTPVRPRAVADAMPVSGTIEDFFNTDGYEIKGGYLRILVFSSATANEKFDIECSVVTAAATPSNELPKYAIIEMNGKEENGDLQKIVDVETKDHICAVPLVIKKNADQKCYVNIVVWSGPGKKYGHRLDPIEVKGP